MLKSCMPELPDTNWFELVPDWVCEVLSPSTAQKDRSLKMPLYAQHEVGWVIGNIQSANVPVVGQLLEQLS